MVSLYSRGQDKTYTHHLTRSQQCNVLILCEWYTWAAVYSRRVFVFFTITMLLTSRWITQRHVIVFSLKVFSQRICQLSVRCTAEALTARLSCRGLCNIALIAVAHQWHLWNRYDINEQVFCWQRVCVLLSVICIQFIYFIYWATYFVQGTTVSITP